MWLFRRGKQQADLAAYLDLTGATTSRKIAGKTQWSVTDLARTAAFLEVPLSELMPEDTVEIARAGMEKAPILSDRGLSESHLRESNSRPIHYE